MEDSGKASFDQGPQNVQNHWFYCVFAQKCWKTIGFIVCSLEHVKNNNGFIVFSLENVKKNNGFIVFSLKNVEKPLVLQAKRP